MQTTAFFGVKRGFFGEGIDGENPWCPWIGNSGLGKVLLERGGRNGIKQLSIVGAGYLTNKTSRSGERGTE